MLVAYLQLNIYDLKNCLRLQLTHFKNAFNDLLVLSIGHKLWFFCISILHPDVEFLTTTSIRTLIDTHRNQGIISVLLSVKGQAQPEAVRRHLQVPKFYFLDKNDTADKTFLCISATAGSGQKTRQIRQPRLPEAAPLSGHAMWDLRVAKEQIRSGPEHHRRPFELQRTIRHRVQHPRLRVRDRLEVYTPGDSPMADNHNTVERRPSLHFVEAAPRSARRESQHRRSPPFDTPDQAGSRVITIWYSFGGG